MVTFDVRADAGVCRVALHGALDYDESNKAIAAAAECAAQHRVDRVLFDLRDADASNYYSYIVRHAEEAPSLGFERSYRVAFVARPESMPVVEFMALVARNHGWQARAFAEIDEADGWLQEA
jgi:hypothetical protein